VGYNAEEQENETSRPNLKKTKSYFYINKQKKNGQTRRLIRKNDLGLVKNNRGVPEHRRKGREIKRKTITQQKKKKKKKPRR